MNVGSAKAGDCERVIPSVCLPGFGFVSGNAVRLMHTIMHEGELTLILRTSLALPLRLVLPSSWAWMEGFADIGMEKFAIGLMFSSHFSLALG